MDKPDIVQFYQQITHFIDEAKRAYARNDYLLPMVYTLYIIHKSYHVISDRNDELICNEEGDRLLDSLKPYFKFPNIYYLYRDLSSWPIEFFEENYNGIIFSVSLNQIIREGKDGFGAITPIDISQLIAYFINKSECKTILDPFCGTASILHYLDNAEFVGQDLNKTCALIARVNYEARYGNSYDFGIENNIKNENSILNWNDNRFDAVVTCPPFNLKLNEYSISRLNKGIHVKVNTLEEGIIYKAFQINNASLTITLFPFSFCYSHQYYDLRKYLVKNNLLDTIIYFPEKVLYNTSISSVLVVCQKKRFSGKQIDFIDASPYCQNDRLLNTGKLFDSSTFIQSFENGNIDNTTAPPSEIEYFDFNLNPHLYIKDETFEIKEGQQIVKLGQLISPASFTRVNRKQKDDRKYYPFGISSRNFIDIILKKELSLDSEFEGFNISSRLYSTNNNEKYILTLGNDSISNIKFSLYTGGDNFSPNEHLRVYIINDNLVDPEYLAYLLINNPRLKDLNIPFTECLKLPVVIDSIQKQKELIANEKAEYARKAKAEQEANEKRLGIKQNISDLEHMLGPTQFRINNIISRLEKCSPDSPNYKVSVKALRDNVDYLNRVIRYTYEQITPESFNMKDGNIAVFMADYSEGWKNYGGNYFSLSLQNNLEEDIIVNFDKTMLTVLFDSILSNAARHSFHKNSKHTDDNRVLISLSLKSVNDLTYVLISVANNGDPFNRGFGISEYITKGRFSSETGRSGLGGYHVYEITKGHNGYMYIDSNYIWNVIIDILLPVKTTINNPISEYEHECI